MATGPEPFEYRTSADFAREDRQWANMSIGEKLLSYPVGIAIFSLAFIVFAVDSARNAVKRFSRRVVHEKNERP